MPSGAWESESVSSEHDSDRRSKPAFKAASLNFLSWLESSITDAPYAAGWKSPTFTISTVTLLITRKRT